MALLPGFFSCFSDSGRIACEGEGSSERRLNKEDEVNEDVSMKKNKSTSKSRPPIPVAYFPLGIRFSHL